MTMNVVVVDTETSGRNPEIHQCVEVGWWDLSTGRRGLFIPRHNVSTTLAGAEIQALRINRYIDRLADQPQDRDGAGPRALADVLDGNTLLGANPKFDAAFLYRVFLDYERDDLSPIPEWRYRLWDLEAYAAGVLGLDHVPGAGEICELLGIPPGDHTAQGDVTAEGCCFVELQKRARSGVFREAVRTRGVT